MEDYSEDIRQAVDVLRRGGVILYPTDTVWGIGCDATNSAAVRRVFDIKRRADGKALITLVESTDALFRVVENVPDVALELIDVSVDPVTIVYDKGVGVAPELPAPDGSLAVRITRERFSARLCRALRRPLVSTSANISGRPTPAAFSDISPEVISAVDYVCSSRRTERREAVRPSMIIKISDNGVFKILRK
ncbi:MAG: threonylcarbamoyl-AMP synthase [Muribaculaceae bacterium]|nr:threonylcarbamoyl-AMP synthase [Muribaculaceae bacterium]MDE6692453.1 threonylcarbamoyl-AMP synthase [Muribaculaceae bacterium]